MIGSMKDFCLGMTEDDLKMTFQGQWEPLAKQIYKDGICYKPCLDNGIVVDLYEVGNKAPLGWQELQELAGKPVYCPKLESYGIVECETKGRWAGVPFLVGAQHQNGLAVRFTYNIIERNLQCFSLF